MEELTIRVEKRDETGDGPCRRLRRDGWVPGVVYGGGRESLAIKMEKKPLLEVLAKGVGEHRIFLLQLMGTDKSRHAMIRDLQIDPVSRQIVHVDFQRVMLDVKLKVKVRVEVSGVPWGVKNEGGVLDFVTRELEIEALPAQIPQEIRLDVSDLHLGQRLEAGQIALPEGVVLVGDPARVVLAIAHSRVEQAAAGEAALAEGKEPEVIKRGKVAEGES